MNAAMKHLKEIMEEAGFDWEAETATSREAVHAVAGLPPIDSWYQENATWEPWRAYLAGVGTKSGGSEEEAVAAVAEAARGRIAAGGLVGPDYLASLRFPAR